MTIYTVHVVNGLPVTTPPYDRFDHGEFSRCLTGFFQDVVRNGGRITPAGHPRGDAFDDARVTIYNPQVTASAPAAVAGAGQRNPQGGNRPPATSQRAAPRQRLTFSGPTAVMPWEVVVYLVSDSQASLVRDYTDQVRRGRSDIQVQDPNPPRTGHLGWTTPIETTLQSVPALSEVFIAQLVPDRGTQMGGTALITPRLAAITAFHEAMHNKVTQGVHTLRGGTFARAVIDETMSMSPADRLAMARDLGRVRPQFLGGPAMLQSRYDSMQNIDI